MTDYDFNWHDLAFASKRPVNNLQAIFIAAPRQLSTARLRQLIKLYLPKANLLFGIAEEEYIDGFEGQPQFKTLRQPDLTSLQSKVNVSDAAHKVYSLTYSQRDLKFILEKLSFQKILLINGSWQYMFHISPAYHIISSKKVDYERVSPFASEQEAKDYAATVLPPREQIAGSYTVQQMLELADNIGRRSFDYCFQTGAALGQSLADSPKYKYIAGAFNKVVPYQTYAMHHGSLREINFSPMNDLNYYDTIHAETALLVQAVNQQFGLDNTCLFINLLPCPNCARMLCETTIKEIYYRQDHSDGYAIKLLETAGKKVTRVVY